MILCMLFLIDSNFMWTADSQTVCTLCLTHMSVMFCSSAVTLPELCLIFRSTFYVDFFKVLSQISLGGGGGDALCLEAPCSLEIAVHKSECPWLFFRSASKEWEWLHRLPRRVLLWLSDNHTGWVWPGKIHQSGTVCLPWLWTRVRDLTVFYRDEVDWTLTEQDNNYVCSDCEPGWET